MYFNELKSIIDIKETNIENNLKFDFFRTQKFIHDDETSYKNMLYFLNYSTYEEVENEWCNHFDLRVDVEKRIDNVKNATFIIEKEQKPFLSKDTRYIVVNNIRNAIEQLYKNKMSHSKAQVIGVTGSVGKTTCVGLIEHLLKAKYKVLRIYSTRIHPILLKGYLLNYLSDDTDFIVMEYAIYAKNHVEDLVDVLSPNIAAVLNITTEHLGNIGLDNREDIIEGKLKIFKNSKINFISQELFKFSSSYQNVHAYNTKNCKAKDNFIHRGILFYPFLNTDLSLQQYIVAINIAFELNLNISEIQGKINNFVPVEHRFLTFKLKNRTIIFMGETIHNSRFDSISDKNSENKILIIRKIGAKSTFTNAISLINSVKKFKKVYVFCDIGNDYISVLKTIKNVELVNNHSFIKSINCNEEILYVYSGYFHTYNELNIKYLNKYDNNYKVKGLEQ